MKKFLLILILCLMPCVSFAKKYHYSSGSYKSKTYYSNGLPKHRSTSARNQFLRQNGFCSYGSKCRVPKGYQVDHIKALSIGGSDTPDNMQLLTIPEHKAKTAREHRLYHW